jgi:hypothetical protein
MEYLERVVRFVVPIAPAAQDDRYAVSLLSFLPGTPVHDRRSLIT